MAVILVLGAGDVGSAVAWQLRAGGHAVVLHDAPSPSHARRGMAFTDAFFEGTSALDGVLAKRAKDSGGLGRMIACGRALPVTDADLPTVLADLSPAVLVDACVHKHDAVPSLIGLARCTIGLGPGHGAGTTADLVVETAWGERLGSVIRTGRASDYAGEPRPLGGHGRERYVYAPLEGILRTTLAIGDAVQEGQPVARVGERAIVAPLSGILRGLTHDGARVRRGAKIVEVDASANRAGAFGLGERPRKIAAGVAAAVGTAREGTGEPWKR